MELDAKHKNIGATASMLQHMTKIFGGDGSEAKRALLDLFNVEARDCDFQQDNSCDMPDNLNGLCNVGTCPLGLHVDEEFTCAADSITL